MAANGLGLAEDRGSRQFLILVLFLVDGRDPALFFVVVLAGKVENGTNEKAACAYHWEAPVWDGTGNGAFWRWEKWQNC